MPNIRSIKISEQRIVVPKLVNDYYLEFLKHKLWHSQLPARSRTLRALRIEKSLACPHSALHFACRGILTDAGLQQRLSTRRTLQARAGLRHTARLPQRLGQQQCGWRCGDPQRLAANGEELAATERCKAVKMMSRSPAPAPHRNG